MNLVLTPKMEQDIEQQLARGFRSPEEVVTAALEVLATSQVSFELSLEELDRKLVEGIAAADRGETLSMDEARAELAAFRASL